MSRLFASVDLDRLSVSTVEDVLDLVRERGGRVTSARRLVLEAIFKAKGHQTAEELAAVVQKRAPDIHLSTIYRNLEDLQELGVVVHAHLGHGPSTYHLAASAHGHFVCEACGVVIEAPDGFVRKSIPIDQIPFRLRDRSPSLRHVGSMSRCRDVAAPDSRPFR